MFRTNCLSIAVRNKRGRRLALHIHSLTLKGRDPLECDDAFRAFTLAAAENNPD